MTKVVMGGGDGAFERINLALKELETKVGKVGWFESAKYKKDGTPIAYIAAIQELGYPAGNIPPRPFMRPTSIREAAAWRNIAEQGAKAIIAGTTTAQDVMTQLSSRAAEDIAKTISALWEPPLAPATIAKRLSRKKDKTVTKSLTKPLIDTGQMYEALTFIVEDEKP